MSLSSFVCEFLKQFYLCLVIFRIISNIPVYHVGKGVFADFISSVFNKIQPHILIGFFMLRFIVNGSPINKQRFKSSVCTLTSAFYFV